MTNYCHCFDWIMVRFDIILVPDWMALVLLASLSACLVFAFGDFNRHLVVAGIVAIVVVGAFWYFAENLTNSSYSTMVASTHLDADSLRTLACSGCHWDLHEVQYSLMSLRWNCQVACWVWPVWTEAVIGVLWHCCCPHSYLTYWMHPPTKRTGSMAERCMCGWGDCSESSSSNSLDFGCISMVTAKYCYSDYFVQHWESEWIALGLAALFEGCWMKSNAAFAAGAYFILQNWHVAQSSSFTDHFGLASCFAAITMSSLLGWTWPACGRCCRCITNHGCFRLGHQPVASSKMVQLQFASPHHCLRHIGLPRQRSSLVYYIRHTAGLICFCWVFSSGCRFWANSSGYLNAGCCIFLVLFAWTTKIEIVSLRKYY